jgi:hypothetical protein
LCVRQGPEGRPHRLGDMGPRAGVEGIRLGQLSGRLGKGARLTGIHHRHGQPRRCQRRHHGPLVAPRGFEDNQGGQQGLQSCDQGGHPGLIVGHGPPFTRGSQSHIQLGFRDIDPDNIRRGRHQHS